MRNRISNERKRKRSKRSERGRERIIRFEEEFLSLYLESNNEAFIDTKTIPEKTIFVMNDNMRTMTRNQIIPQMSDKLLTDLNTLILDSGIKMRFVFGQIV
jgi:hypothetical protein